MLCAAGPPDTDAVPPSERPGKLWDLYRKLEADGWALDAFSYTTNFRWGCFVRTNDAHLISKHILLCLRVSDIVFSCATDLSRVMSSLMHCYAACQTLPSCYARSQLKQLSTLLPTPLSLPYSRCQKDMCSCQLPHNRRWQCFLCLPLH